tara:strand:- start:628 stop:819 length:192 start_codon:yes stop_codon:yes gene_type:complete
MRNTETQSAGIQDFNLSSSNAAGDHEQTWDAVETYFECITTCSLDDGECITRCVEQLKDADDA